MLCVFVNLKLYLFMSRLYFPHYDIWRVFLRRLKPFKGHRFTLSYEGCFLLPNYLFQRFNDFGVARTGFCHDEIQEDNACYDNGE